MFHYTQKVLHMNRIATVVLAVALATAILSPPALAQYDGTANANVSLPDRATVALCAHLLRRYSVVPSHLWLGWLPQVPAAVARRLGRMRLYRAAPTDPTRDRVGSQPHPYTRIEITAARFRGRRCIDLEVAASFNTPRETGQSNVVGVVRLVSWRRVWRVSRTRLEIRDGSELPAAAEVQAIMLIAARHLGQRALYLDPDTRRPFCTASLPCARKSGGYRAARGRAPERW